VSHKSYGTNETDGTDGTYRENEQREI
jgi:hypothetical protein